jgi:FMN phosphatase YigB (HAD superfamily)
MCDWLPAQFDVPDDSASPRLLQRIREIKESGEFINARSLGIPEDAWQQLKHRFRVEGVKRRLPVFPDAYLFLERMRMDGYKIVLLTSRPIDRYPNIFTDTILWLNENRLPYDFVWWSLDKAERIVQMQDLQPRVRLAVDDDERFVKQFADIGIPTYWLQRHGCVESTDPRITSVVSLLDVGRFID